ncbi:hypothetical protein HPB47_016906 [Ixodes persulcatus]|uniref:Uncharacterized protein n=1 Tax=Ixodes persulcatus TaxID=34615 RepID=A0AC60QPX0_IXOPE|nr:hypothetical protein HPB47_016906 [Ixodes persulcatus]
MAVVLSEYGASLRAFARSRYVEKVRLSGGTDPLLFDDDDTVMEHDLYSKVQDIDIKDYLVGKTSVITREQFKAHKALEAHNYLTSRWVQPPRLKVLPNGDVVVIGKADILKECENVASGISIEPESLVQRMCYPDNHYFTTRATAWGIEKEQGARKMNKLQRRNSRPHNITVEQQVLVALRFYTAGGFQGTVASDERIAVHQCTVSRVLVYVSEAIIDCLGASWLRFAHTRAEKTEAQKFFRRCKYSGVIGYSGYPLEPWLLTLIPGNPHWTFRGRVQ